jgi:hypothetical protein
MLAPPATLEVGFQLGLFFCFAVGATFSIPSVWKRFFKEDANGVPAGGAYLKAGEYGETEYSNTWSVFKEPLNAWTSLAYSWFGVVICYVGWVDYTTILDRSKEHNRMIADAGFSLMIGSFCIYLGVSSFLFHASHTEVWRKADAGMTSGICIPLVMFAIWDRSRIPGLSPLLMMSMCSFLLFSLTNGFVPYGSSDILLPGMIIIVWSLELLPRYGGPQDSEQYIFWARCLFAVAGGALLRAIDVKRKEANVKVTLTGIYFVLALIFGATVGYSDFSALCAIAAGVTVIVSPSKGHIFWHIASAYALYIWWYMLRIRPGNPPTPYTSDNTFWNLLLFIAVKNGFRRLTMTLPAYFIPAVYHDRLRLVVEHLVFTAWGYVTVIDMPGAHSWYLTPILCWFTPVYPSAAFTVYYTAKVATHVEDVLFLWATGSTVTKPAQAQAVQGGGGGGGGGGKAAGGSGGGSGGADDSDGAGGGSGGGSSQKQQGAGGGGGGSSALSSASPAKHLGLGLSATATSMLSALKRTASINSMSSSVPESPTRLELARRGSNATSTMSLAALAAASAAAAADIESNKVQWDDEDDPKSPVVSLMTSRSERAEGEVLRSFHHNVAAMIAVVSLFTGKLQTLS